MNRRRKHVLQTKEKEICWPQENRHFAKALGARGDNLVEVEFEDGTSSLVLLPARFNKKLWIRSGTFLVVEQQSGKETGDKGRISGTIEDVLYKNDIDHLRRQKFWPAAFESKTSKAAEVTVPVGDGGDSDSSSDGNRSPLQPNNNRPNISYFELEDSESDAEESRCPEIH